MLQLLAMNYYKHQYLCFSKLTVMKYTSYYSQLLKSKGIPHLTVSQQQHIMNIVYLEGGIAQIDKLKCSGESQANKSKTIFKLEAQLYNLTKKQAPEVLFQQLFQTQH